MACFEPCLGMTAGKISLAFSINTKYNPDCRYAVMSTYSSDQMMC
jgi:hypothetical protein